MIRLLKGTFAVIVLALMSVYAAQQPAGLSGTFSSTSEKPGLNASGPFAELFSIFGKWPTVAGLAVITLLAALAVIADYRKTAALAAPKPVAPKPVAQKPAAAPPMPRVAKNSPPPASGYSADRIARALGQTATAPAAASPAPAMAFAQPQAAPTPGQDSRQLSDKDKEFVAKMLAGVTAQVQHEQDLDDLRGKEPVSVRLVPQVPIHQPENATAWLGGGARLPEGFDWPDEDGTKLQLIAQFDCGSLPADVWEGLGPRHGWLAIFLNPKTAKPTVLHFADAGPYQTSPPLDSECNIVGLDMRPGKSDERPRPVQAFPRWPVDVVAVRSGENDPRVAGSSEVQHRRYAEEWDVTEPRFQPFDWESARVMMDLAVKTIDKRLYRGEIRAQLKPEAMAAAEARLADAKASGAEASKLLEMQLNLDEAKAALVVHAESVANGDRMVDRLKALKAQVEDMSASQPFSAAAVAPILAEMQGMQVLSIKVPPFYRDGQKLSLEQRAEEGVTVRPLAITAHDRDRLSWAHSFVGYLQDRAKHLYAADPDSLPEALRADCEAMWQDRARREMGGFGHVPWNYVHDFDSGKDVTLLELPSSHLLNWQFGDVDHLVLTLKKADLAQGRFDQVLMQVSN